MSRHVNVAVRNIRARVTVVTLNGDQRIKSCNHVLESIVYPRASRRGENAREIRTARVQGAIETQERG